MRKHARRDLMTGTGNRNAYREKVDQLNRHIADGSRTDGGPAGEYLTWIDLDDCEGLTIYPEFFLTEDFERNTEFRHFITRDYAFEVK